MGRVILFASFFLLVFNVNGENRVFYPSDMQGYPGEDVTIQLMLETDVTLLGYGFSSTIDTSAFEFTLPDDEAFTWEGSAAETGNLPMRFCSYVAANQAFGGYALNMMGCDPGVSPGEHVAVNVHIHIKESAAPGVYTFGVPYPENPCAFTDCDNNEIFPNEYDGYFTVLAAIELTAPDSVSVDEGGVISFDVTATDAEPTAQVCLWATDLPPNASFDSTCATGSVTATFQFNPDHCQDGEYQITFHGWDNQGHVAQKSTLIRVHNVNRPPDMDGGPDRGVIPGDTLIFTVKATDLDYQECGDDTLTLNAIDLPGTSTFSQDTDTTGVFYWATTLADTGSYTVTFFAEDRFGLADSDEVNIKVTFLRDSLIIVDAMGYPGQIDVPVNLISRNFDPIYQYKFLFTYDPTLILATFVDTVGTASAGALQFVPGTQPGVVTVLCQMDSANPIPPGRNLLVKVLFSVDPEVKPPDTSALHLPPEWNDWPNLVDGIFVIAPGFIRGDADCDADLATPDAVHILRYKFIPGYPRPLCMDAADADDNGWVEMPDAVHIMRYLFIPGSPPPPPPFPECGCDPTPDDLNCGCHPCWAECSSLRSYPRMRR